MDEAITASLSSLGLDFVDLYLMVLLAMSSRGWCFSDFTIKHWPCSTNPDDTTKHLDETDFIKTW